MMLNKALEGYSDTLLKANRFMRCGRPNLGSQVKEAMK